MVGLARFIERTVKLRVGLLFLVLVLAKASAYWVGTAIQRPDDPFSTVVLYRGKDIQSFPILKNLSQFGLGEPSLYEGHNNGVLSERYVPWMIHALSFRLFGESGFVVADLLLTPLRYLLFAQFLMMCGIRPVVARAMSAILTCAAIDNFGESFWVIPWLPIRFWGLRLPRPYISEFFMLLVLIGAILAVRRIAARERPADWACAVVGVGMALLIQSDFYQAIGLGLGLVGVTVLQLFQGATSQRTMIVRGVVVAACWGVPCLIPMAAQSLFLNPEGPTRLGLFSISRFPPPMIADRAWIASLLLMTLVAVWLRRASTEIMDREGHRSAKQAGRLVLVTACWGALLAMPFMTVVTGQGIELYHFRDSYVRLFSLTALVVGLHVAEVARLRLAGPGFPSLAPRALSLAGIIAVATVCGYFIWQVVVHVPRTESHMRAEFPEWGAVQRYRSGFVELARELSRPVYDDRLVLGTFDTQLWSWWVTFRGGYSFLADACTTNARDTELEQRTASLAKQIGMTPDTFVGFVNRPYVNIFWIGCSKYQASKAFTFSTPDDYDEAQLAGIRATTIFGNFAVALPRSQQRRLKKVFEDVNVSSVGRLDLIALTKDQSTAGLAPPAPTFSLVFENAVFRVWARSPDPPR